MPISGPTEWPQGRRAPDGMAAQRIGRNPWLVWGAGLVVYVLAVANRTSFGVAGLVAATRFGVTATELSLFVVVQLAVYAAMQLPAGMALDVWGPRRLLVIGAIAMSLGQLAMAVVPTLQLALAARVLIGAGDASIFVSAVRLVWDWFPRGRVPLLTQLTGLTGQLGQVISAFPFAVMLGRVGWVPAFVALAIAGVIAATVAALFVVRRPEGGGPDAGGSDDGGLDDGGPMPTTDTAGFAAAIKHPATWLGFFAHMLGGVSSTVFVLMWGVPFMVVGEGYADNTASIMLTLVVITTLVTAPLIGQFTARYPDLRVAATLIVGGIVAIGWAIALVPANPLPVPIFAAAVVLIAIGGPASLIGLDLAATYNAPNRRSTVQGIANMGGFVGAIAVMLTVGLILDYRTGGLTPSLTDYRIALSVVAAPLTISALGLLVLQNQIGRGDRI